MTTTVVGPTSMTVNPGAATLAPSGGGTHVSHIATDDSAYLHAGTFPAYNNYAFTTEHVYVTPPGGWRINYVYLRMVTRFVASTNGYFYPVAIIGEKTTDSTLHRLNLPTGPPGPGSLTMHTVNTGISTHATDGTPWNDCDKFWVEWNVMHDTGSVGTPWDASNYPQLDYVAVVIEASGFPLPYDIEPDSTVTVSQPTVSWTILTTTGQKQTAFRVIVVPDGAEDADGIDAGVDPFDPETSDEVMWDSGKVYGPQQSIQIGEPLANGEYWTYVKSWDGVGATEIESNWDLDSAATFTVDGDTVALPALTLSDDTASYTTEVEIIGGVGGVDHLAASIQVQRWDPVAALWRTAPIADGTVAGTGTSTFYDPLGTPGTSVSYRARGVYVTGAGALFVSAWDTDSYVMGDLEQHWLRSTVDHTLNRSMQDANAILVKSWKTQRERPQNAAYGIGARAATVSYDVMKGNLHQLEVWTLGATAYDGLRALLDGGDDLVLVSQWGETWRCQVGPDVSEDWQRAAPTGAETTPLGQVRILTFSLIEVVTP